MCIDQKLHQVTLRNVLFLFVISIINTIIDAFISIGYSQFYLLLREYFDLTYSQISIISPIMGIFVSVIKLLILIGLFKLMGSINRNEQQAYVMPQANHRDFFAFLFTTIFCLPSMMILLPLLPSMISGFLYSYIGFNFLDTNLLMTLNALLAPTLLTFFSIAISFIIIYFSVKSCFIREFNTIPLKLLLKAVGWAYLYLILFNIVINIIYFVISFSIVSSMHSYSLAPTAIMLVMLLSVVFVVASIVGMVMFTRKAVRKYFSQYNAI
ncbi:hypothetical protein [Orbus mooreae]|uniref:hypothetical protein n=1 Tax=Orbus mooreae TaxID=3074107 RepID=UPI00370D3639